MRNLKFLVVTAVLILGVIAGWQIASHEIANFELQDDLHDLSSQLGARIGFNAPRSDEDYRLLVVHKAAEHGIDLKPDQVTVQRREHGDDTAPIELAADYTVPVNVPGYSFAMHFSVSTAKRNVF